jgi:hypothetical protein
MLTLQSYDAARRLSEAPDGEHRRLDEVRTRTGPVEPTSIGVQIRPPVIASRPSLRGTLEQLALDFANAVLRAVVTELAEAAKPSGAGRTTPRERRPSSPSPRAVSPSAPTRSPRPPRTRGTPIRREPERAVEELDEGGAYPDVLITDPLAVLAALDRAPSVPEAASVALLEKPRAPEAQTARLPLARAGEEVVRSTGGGSVLRRRRLAR